MVYAMFAMVVLVVLVAIAAISARLKAVRQKAVKVRSFKLMNGEMPESVIKTTRSFNNQFELPTLFYVVAILNLTVVETTTTSLSLAWAFVATRYIHAFIHVTYNHLLHRMISFWLGIVCIFALWVELLLRVG